MSFRPINVAVFFSALVGVSFVMSDVAKADSAPENVVYEVQNENQTSSNGSVITQEVSQDNSTVAEGQISSDSSQTAIISNTSNLTMVSNESDSENSGTVSRTTINNKQQTELGSIDTAVKATSSNLTDQNKPVELQTSLDQSSAVALTQETLTNEVKVKITTAIDQARVTNGLVRHKSNKRVVQPAITNDSGDVATQAKNSPTPANPPLPIGGFGQFTALLNQIVLPVSQLSFGALVDSVLPWAAGILSLPIVLVLLVIVGVSLFVANLRKSGFSHGARSDIPVLPFTIAVWLKTSLAKVATATSPYSFLNCPKSDRLFTA